MQRKANNVPNKRNHALSLDSNQQIAGETAKKIRSKIYFGRTKLRAQSYTRALFERKEYNRRGDIEFHSKLTLLGRLSERN